MTGILAIDTGIVTLVFMNMLFLVLVVVAILDKYFYLKNN